ncbi:DUF6270 domain-containing protein [Arthrobacter sp. 179]|uniref:DUF6270 domain-containing protein n=1 Tax=Arthrobacter sp. 179 TaxID=3457734 RepID=UPI0040349F45
MKGIFAYGGCVSRDSFELLKTEYKLLGYVARQSLVSSGHAPIVVQKERTQLASPFQQRQLRGDLHANLFPMLQRFAGASDAIVMDLIVERLGVRQYQQGFLTRSNELARSPLGKSLTTKDPSVRFATDRHFKLWSYSARQLVRVLQKESVLDRTLVFDTPWASHTQSGIEVAGFRNEPPSTMNELYEPYYAYLRELGLRVPKLPHELVLSDDNHQWGVAPYHYIPAAYSWMAEQVRALPPRPVGSIDVPQSGERA